MDAFSALSAVTNYSKLEKTGFRVNDGTNTALGTEYHKLHGDVKFVHCIDAEINDEEDDVEMPIVVNRPELGTLWQPNVEGLLKVCTASKFGHGNQTVLDPKVRQSVELVFKPEDLVSQWLINCAFEAATALFVRPLKEANEEREDFIEEYAPKLAHNYAGCSLRRRSQWLEESGLTKPLHVPEITVEADKLVIYRPGDHFAQPDVYWRRARVSDRGHYPQQCQQSRGFLHGCAAQRQSCRDGYTRFHHLPCIAQKQR
jgi:hypothetical protein